MRRGAPIRSAGWKLARDARYSMHNLANRRAVRGVLILLAGLVVGGPFDLVFLIHSPHKDALDGAIVSI
jgi:hypothetical protein